MSANVADGLLVDVHEANLADLDFTDCPALDLALKRLISSNSGCNFNSFTSSI